MAVVEHLNKIGLEFSDDCHKVLWAVHRRRLSGSSRLAFVAVECEPPVAALVEARNVVAQLLGECGLVPGGELSVEEQKIESCGVPLAGNGRLLDDAGVVVAYGLVEFGDCEQRVGDVQYDVAFGHVAVE
jgi:hypothetical protein